MRQASIAWGIVGALIVAGCGSDPGPVGGPGVLPDPGGPTAPTVVYHPGDVSVDPVINAARPAIFGSTLAGTGVAGSQDGAGDQATFLDPQGVEAEPDGAIIVSEAHAYRLRRIDSSGWVSTLAGGASGQPGRQDGAGSAASFMGPTDAAVGPQGELYVADFDAVRRVSAQGEVSTLALHRPDGSQYQPIEMFGIARGAAGELFISTPSAIERIDPSGEVTRWAGNDTKGFADDVGERAAFNLPRKLALAPDGTLYVADFGNLRVRAISPDRRVRTVAGNGILGFTDGPAGSTRLNFPMGLAVGPDGQVAIADTYNHAIRQLAPGGQVTTLAGNNAPGYADGAATLQLNLPSDVAVRPDGAWVVADTQNLRIRVLR